MTQINHSTVPAIPGEFDNPSLRERLRQIPALPWNARDGIFLATAVALGLLIADWALWGGFNLGFSICYALLLIWTLAYRGRSVVRARPIGIFCGAASLAGAGLFAWTADELLCFLWLWMIALLFCVFAASVCGVELGGGLRLIGDALRSILPAPFRNIHRPFLSMAVSGNARGGRMFRQVLLGLLLAAPVLAIVLPLLIGSDAAFEGLFRSLVGNLGDVPFKLILGLILAALIFSLGFALRKGLVKAPVREEREARGILGTAAVVTLLGMLLLVYAAYLLSQLAYFFSAFSGILPEGYVFTAAEYARRGFFELCAVCAVNLLVVCILPRLTRREEGVPGAVKALCALVCVFCLIFAAVAFSKMALYVQRFGLTRLRLLTSAFMALLVCVLLIALVQLFVNRLPAAQLVLVLACVLGLALGYAKPDAWIARYNVARYQAGTLEAIDVEYLGGLSADAVPELIALLDSPDESLRTAAAQALDWKRELYCTADEAAPDGFRAWNRSRNAARALLTENSARISALLEGSPER